MQGVPNAGAALRAGGEGDLPSAAPHRAEPLPGVRGERVEAAAGGPPQLLRAAQLRPRHLRGRVLGGQRGGRGPRDQGGRRAGELQ